MFSYFREKTVGLASTVAEAGTDAMKAVGMQEVSSPETNGHSFLNDSSFANSSYSRDISASFHREMSYSERVQRILSKRRRLKEQDRLFLLNYAGNTPRNTINQEGNTSNGESLDQLFKNLIIIINHFFEYGFIKQKEGEPGVNSKNYSSDGFETESMREERSRPITHYWDLISKYFSYYSSVAYINQQMEEVSA